MKEQIQEVIKFVHEFGNTYFPAEDLEPVIKKHLEFNTLIVLKKKEEIVCACRFNVLHTGLTAHVLDFIVRDTWEKKGLISYVTAIGWSRFPTLKYLTWERESKYPERPPKIVKIGRVIGRFNNGRLKDSSSTTSTTTSTTVDNTVD